MTYFYIQYSPSYELIFLVQFFFLWQTAHTPPKKKVAFNIIFRFLLVMGYVYTCVGIFFPRNCACTGNLAFSFHIFHHLAVSLVNYFRAMFSNPQTLSAMSL